MDATIVIPTKNGGKLLDDVLTQIDNQKTHYLYEIVCVDSGSSDNTVDIIKKHNCILKQISKERLLRYNGIDCNKYNSDKVYALIKQNNIPYTKINKDTVLSMIIKMEKKKINIASNSISNFYVEEKGRKKGKRYKTKTIMKHKRKRSN